MQKCIADSVAIIAIDWCSGNARENEIYEFSVMVDHCLHATAPRYLSELCTFIVIDVASRRHLRSVCQNELMVPCHKLTSAGRRAFSVAAPSVWNSLADYLRDPALGLKSFGRHLKTFFAHY